MTPPLSVIRRIGAEAMGAFAVLAITSAPGAGAWMCTGDPCDAPFKPATGPPACIGTEAMRAACSATAIADAEALRAGDGLLGSACGNDFSTT